MTGAPYLDALGLKHPGQDLDEFVTIGEESAREPGTQGFQDRRLCVRGELPERLRRLQAFDTLRRRLEVLPQGPLDADFPVSEVGGVEGLGRTRRTRRCRSTCRHRYGTISLRATSGIFPPLGA